MRRSTRIRGPGRTTYRISVVLTALLTATCVFAQFRHAWVRYAHDEVTRDESVAEGVLGAWVTRVPVYSASLNRGGLYLTSGPIFSAAASRPPPDQFASLRGWQGGMVPLERVRPDSRPANFFEGVTDWRVLGIGLLHMGIGGATGRILQIPFWLMIIAAAAPGVWSWRRSARYSRWRLEGRCMRCGYLPGAGVSRCPECGHSFERDPKEEKATNPAA